VFGENVNEKYLNTEMANGTMMAKYKKRKREEETTGMAF